MIDLPHPQFQTQKLSVEPGGFWRGPSLLLNGAKVEGKRGVYAVRDDAGAEVTVTVRIGFPDVLPKVTIAGAAQALGRPFEWYEWAWIGLPAVLMLLGGALGGGVGAAAMMINARIFRGEHGPVSKYAMSAGVTVAAYLVVVILATIVSLLIGR